MGLKAEGAGSRLVTVDFEVKCCSITTSDSDRTQLTIGQVIDSQCMLAHGSSTAHWQVISFYRFMMRQRPVRMRLGKEGSRECRSPTVLVILRPSMTRVIGPERCNCSTCHANQSKRVTPYACTRQIPQHGLHDKGHSMLLSPFQHNACGQA
eukprot:2127972-Rhodomonas_salina.1